MFRLLDSAMLPLSPPTAVDDAIFVVAIDGLQLMQSQATLFE